MKKIIFVTPTRADYGKLKSLISIIQKNKKYKVYIFVTGMHNLKKYGSTYEEILKDKFRNIFRFNNQKNNKKMDMMLSSTIYGFSKFVKKTSPDLIIVHGDRVESLASSIV